MDIHVSFQVNYKYFGNFYNKYMLTVYSNPIEFTWLNDKILRVQCIRYDDGDLFKAVNSMFFSVSYHKG